MSEKYNSIFMQESLNLANIAFKNDEVPVGAVVVLNNKIIGKGHNQVRKRNSVTSHAEINAINDASNTLGNYRLNECQIYVSLEPCHMCAKAIIDARIHSLFFGALEPKTGAVQSIDRFLDRKDLNHSVIYSGGHMAERSTKLLKNFFRSRR
tara:strand:- start:835 stop:1290 length:456 start_codon:yes stop_codon:yes gene_type:complete